MKSILAITTLAFMLASCTEEKTTCTNLQNGTKGTATFAVCLGAGCPTNPAPSSVRYNGADGFETKAAYNPKEWKCTRNGKEGV